jgi:excinuclease ABC subunit C
LIDKYKPKYNILLRYNNNYPYILLTQEKNPRLVYTRNKDLKGKYYGPFAISTFKKFDIYKMLNQIFLLRKCNPLKKAKCLYYDIGQCVGPCINKISEEKYEEIKKEIDNFFKGNNSELLKKLKEKELNFSKNNDYENALKTNELINSILQLKKHDNQNNFNFKNKNINVIN